MSPDPGMLHFLRPDWLWALVALPLFVLWWRRRRRRGSVWHGAVDPHLLPALLERKPARAARLAPWLGGLGFVLGVIALAGPSWRQVEQPLWQTRMPLVIALDLSSATLAGDLPPSRLAQARSKLATLLAEREGGQVGLVAWAEDAYTVAPVTDDAANVALFLDSLHPNVMPVDGQRADRAITWSARLLEQAGFDQGTILLLTDHADAAALDAARSANARGYEVSVLGLGSTAGAPYRAAGGGFASTRLEPGSLRALAAAGGGAYASISNDASDLSALGVLDATGAGERTQSAAPRWQDGGFWLLPPLMLLALLAFRRGAPVAVVLLVLWWPSGPAYAADLWQRPDQAAHERMQEAAKAYRDGDFADAAALYAQVEGAEADYNRGNALAKAGQYPQAIEAYDDALRRQPAMEDAIANRQAVEAAMQRQPQGGDGDGDDSRQDRDSDPQSNGGDAGKPSQASPDAQGRQGEQPPSGNDTPPAESPQESPTGEPADPDDQQAANAAQRERMEQALREAREQDGTPEGEPGQARVETAEERERRLANEAWLRRIPDDPGGLLREKFRLEHERRRMQEWEP